MTIEEFIELFEGEMDEVPAEGLKPETDFKNMDEWSSLTALSIISMADEEYDKRLTPSELRNSTTIEELWKLIEAK